MELMRRACLVADHYKACRTYGDTAVVALKMAAILYGENVILLNYRFSWLPSLNHQPNMYIDIFGLAELLYVACCGVEPNRLVTITPPL